MSDFHIPSRFTMLLARLCIPQHSPNVMMDNFCETVFEVQIKCWARLNIENTWRLTSDLDSDKSLIWRWLLFLSYSSSCRLSHCGRYLIVSKLLVMYLNFTQANSLKRTENLFADVFINKVHSVDVMQADFIRVCNAQGREMFLFLY